MMNLLTFACKKLASCFNPLIPYPESLYFVMSLFFLYMRASLERNEKIKNLVKTSIIDAGCNNSLMEFASLVNLCNILVASDSLALHIGVALKKKIVCFFCPTSANEIELYNRGIKILPKVGCLCCYKPKCSIPPVYDVDEIVDGVKSLI